MTKTEELLNSITHGIGFGLAVAGCVLVIYQATGHSAAAVTASSVFGASMVLLYLASTLYHSLSFSRFAHFFRKLDHMAIYILIAGTYTPFCLVGIGGAWGWSIFGVSWGLALLGIVFKAWFTGRYEILSTVAYVVMGWLAVICAHELINSLSTTVLTYLLIGGGAYTLGAVVFAWEKLHFNHAIWHLFVIAGSVMHFFAVYSLVS